MTYTVEARGLSKSFGKQKVLDSVDLDVRTASVLALLGPNGAGKTTLVRILATLLRPDAGTATIGGCDLLTNPIGVKRAISLTGQHAAIDNVLTGQENLEMMARLHHLPRRSVRTRVAELLAEFDLTEARDRRTGTYSGGMKRRLDLAISMISRPHLMFLDEPTTGLDPRSRDQLWSTVRHLVEQGVTVLLTTQYLEEADQLADTVAVLNRGRVVARGTPDQLKANVGGEVLRLQFAETASYEGALACLAAEPTPDRQRTLDFATDGSATQLLAVLRRLEEAGMAASRVTSHRPSLDQVFLSLTSTDHEAKELVR